MLFAIPFLLFALLSPTVPSQRIEAVLLLGNSHPGFCAAFSLRTALLSDRQNRKPFWLGVVCLVPALAAGKEKAERKPPFEVNGERQPRMVRNDQDDTKSFHQVNELDAWSSGCVSGRNFRRIMIGVGVGWMVLRPLPTRRCKGNEKNIFPDYFRIFVGKIMII